VGTRHEMKRKNSKIHRIIYEKYYNCCLLPFIEIHHVDGNHNNNDITNLKPVTALEHYQIHLSQGDKAAAALIGVRANISVEIRSQLSREQAVKNNALGRCGFSLGHASTAGKKGGIKGGAYAKQNRTGIFALTPEQNKQRHFNSVVTKMIKNGKASAWPRTTLI
jgi:hypothetical protein